MSDPVERARRAIEHAVTASLKHNIAAMKDTNQLPSFEQVLLTFETTEETIERMQAALDVTKDIGKQGDAEIERLTAALDDECKAHAVCVQMRDAAYAEIDRLQWKATTDLEYARKQHAAETETWNEQYEAMTARAEQSERELTELRAGHAAVIEARDMMGNWWAKERARAEKAERLVGDMIQAQHKQEQEIERLKQKLHDIELQAEAIQDRAPW